MKKRSGFPYRIPSARIGENLTSYDPDDRARDSLVLMNALAPVVSALSSTSNP
jgi:hypothetical protein